MSPSMLARQVARPLGVLAAVVLVAACSAAGGSSAGVDELSEDRAGQGDAGAGASGSSGETGAFTPGSGGGTSLDECAVAEVEPHQLDVSMFIAVDKSGSMVDDGKWQAARAAFSAFFLDPAADSLQVALGFWPFGSCNDSLCSVAGCAVPLVPLGRLDDLQQELALLAAFNMNAPDGWTPMSAALGGACAWAVARQQSHLGTERVVVVFLTDGEPTACDLDVGNIAQQAAMAHAQAGVRTFAVGLAGSYEAHLDLIAQAGQTGEGFFIGSGNVQAELVAALNGIRETVMACSFAMPDSGDPATPVDPALVNVTLSRAGAEPVTLPQVDGLAACGAAGGWAYDDPVAPHGIELCGSTCDSVQGDPQVRIEIVLGCETQTT